MIKLYGAPVSNYYNMVKTDLQKAVPGANDWFEMIGKRESANKTFSDQAF
jgi:hypothetical protein